MPVVTPEPAGKLVLTRVSGGVATITLNRAERHNSLVPSLLVALIEAVNDAEARQDVHVIVLRANGSSFSTGGDLRGFLDNEHRIEDYAADVVGSLNEAISRLIETPLPVVVAVDGQVTGGSMGLVLAADVVVVSERASFTPYYPVIGFSPDGGWTALLPDIIGRTRTADVLAANRTISAQQAVDWGIASRIVGSDAIDASIADICRKLVGGTGGAIAMSKRLLVPANYQDRLEAERRQFIEQVGQDEAMAGIRAFVQRGSRDSS